jgi:hypothetical protein
MTYKGNGCGPDWMPIWSKELLFNWFHEASCNKHDIGYEEGGDEARRIECDKKFLEAMRRDSFKQRGPFRLLYLVQAYSYYGLVRAFKGKQFNYKGEL